LNTPASRPGRIRQEILYADQLWRQQRIIVVLLMVTVLYFDVVKNI